MLDKFSFNRFVEEVGEEVTRELFSFFISETRERLARIKILFSAGDIDNLRRECHSLKGAALTYALPDLSQLSHLLETAAGNDTVSQKDTDTLVANGTSAIDELESYLGETI